MSVKLMGMVFDRYPVGGGELVLALAIADHAEHDGTSIFPSVPKLAAKTRQSERTVQYQLRRMEESGWLQLVEKERTWHGGGRPREYKISAEWIAGGELKTPAKNQESAAENCGANSAPQKVSGANGNSLGVQLTTVSGATAIAPEPSLTVIEPSVIISADFTAPKRKHQFPKTFHPDADTLAYLTGSGIDAAQEFNKFRDYHLAKGSKFIDWQAAFRNWARNAVKFAKQAPGKQVDARQRFIESVFGGSDANNEKDITPQSSGQAFPALNA